MRTEYHTVCNEKLLLLHVGVWLILIPSPCMSWVAWEPWDSCSQSCGGGYRHREGSICCRQGIDTDHNFKFKGMWKEPQRI